MIIGIDGYAGAGKDTVADILVKLGFTKLAFADELRKAASHSFGFEIETFTDRELKDKPFKSPFRLSPRDICEFCDYLGFEDKCDEAVLKFKHTEVESPRHLLQFVGTEIGRETLSSSIWLDKYVENLPYQGMVVTSDARFENERRLIKSRRGLIMWVDKEGVEPESTHKSANEKWPLDKYDVIVYNNGRKCSLRHDVSIWWGIRGNQFKI